MICSVRFLFAAFVFCLQRFFYLQFSFFICSVLFYLQRFFFVCSVSFLFAACPLWAIVVIRKETSVESEARVGVEGGGGGGETSHVLTRPLLDVK